MMGEEELRDKIDNRLKKFMPSMGYLERQDTIVNVMRIFKRTNYVIDYESGELKITDADRAFLYILKDFHIIHSMQIDRYILKENNIVDQDLLEKATARTIDVMFIWYIDENDLPIVRKEKKPDKCDSCGKTTFGLTYRYDTDKHKRVGECDECAENNLNETDDGDTEWN